jgi:hypothetical protein
MSPEVKCLGIVVLFIVLFFLGRWALQGIITLEERQLILEETRRKRILDLLGKHTELLGRQIIELDPATGDRHTIFIRLSNMVEEGLLACRDEPGPLPEPWMIPRQLYSLDRTGRGKHDDDVNHLVSLTTPEGAFI